MYLLSYISHIMYISIEKEATPFMMDAGIASSRTIEHNTDKII
jgi:hypothetical protein